MKFPSFDLTAKVAVVTGGGQGIGKAIALSMAHFGASVAVADVNLKEAEKVVREISHMGGKAIYIKVDITDLKQISEMANRVVNTFGGIDILANVAGVLLDSGPAEETTTEIWDKTMSVNLKGMFFCSQAVGKLMIKQKTKGKIINIASVLAFSSLPNLSAYNTSKSGVLALTRSLAIDWAKYGINVNAVCPATTRTPMTADYLADKVWYQYFVKRFPLGRVGEPEDIAGAVVYLASPASDWVTGQTLVVDGGWIAGEIGP